MLDNEEKFFNYIKNNMTKSEMDSFEEELKSSDKMQKDLESYKKIFSIVEDTKNIKLNYQYTQTIIPSFRSKLERNSKVSFVSRYGFALATLFVALVAYSVINNLNEQNQTPQKLYSNITTDEANYIADKMNLDLSKDMNQSAEIRIDSVYDQDLNESIDASLNDRTIQNYSKDLSIQDLGQYLSDKDVDIIYTELLNKKIL